MQIYSSIDAFPEVKNVVLTTGTFDGVHKGHKVILDRLNRIAKNINGESVLLTFDPHPRKIVKPNEPISLLTTIEEKIDLLAKTGLQHLVVHPFDQRFSQISSLDFIRELLVKKLLVKKLVIGYDHHFGRNREGSFEHLSASGKEYGFEVEEIPVQEIDEVAVSSTKIRNAIQNANVEQAAEWLGYNYFLSGEVIRGKGLGRTISFPTANIQVSNTEKMIPGNGVYMVQAKIEGLEKPLLAMCNIGFNPTVGGKERSVEVHVFDFSGDLYSKKISISFLKKIRDEKKFNSLEELQRQLNNDAHFVNQFAEENQI
jgi:riboflavin kinase/FMN adenylyltransferase